MRRLTFLVALLFVSGVFATQLDLTTSLLTMNLQDISLLDTTAMSCSTPQSEFQRVSSQMAAWADIVQHKDYIPQDINTLQSLKKLIQKKKVDQIESKLKDLKLPTTASKIGEPILAEFRHQLKSLNDPQKSQECQETLLKLCIYLIKQFNDCRRQCVSNPVTVIKIKGKIKDLQIVQQGCGDEPPCEDEPIPVAPEPTTEDPVSPPEEYSEEEGAVTPPEPTPLVDPTPDPKAEESVPEGEEEGVVPHHEEQPEPKHEETTEPPVGEEEVTTDPEPEEQTEEAEKPEDPHPHTEETSEPEEETSEPEEHEETTADPVPDNEKVTAEEETEEAEETTETTTEIAEEEVPSEEEGSVEEEPPKMPESEEETFEEHEPTPIETTNPPSEEEEEVQEKTCVTSLNTQAYTASVQEETPVYQKSFTHEDGSLHAYSFGFYMKWLTRYPTQMLHGREDPSYFIAGFEKSISLHLTEQGFEFGVGESTQTIPAGDIEGQWIYVHFSYSSGKAVGIVKFNEGDAQVVEIEATPADEATLNFNLAGKNGDSKSFQGIFRSVQARIGSTSSVSNADELNQFVLACNVLPEEKCERETSNLHEFEFKGKDSVFDATKAYENETPVFSQEYSVSGWFKWSPIADQASWHTAFRLTLNNVATNQNAKLLGDRDLALFIGNEKKDSMMAFTTYTYTDLHGNGNPTSWQAVPYQNDLTHWHYIYFGYSRKVQKAYAFVEFLSRKGEVHFPNTKHYDAPHKILYVGQDQFYPAYNGKIFNLHYNLCEGSYKELNYDEHFGYTPKPSDPVPTPPPEESEEELSEEEVISGPPDDISEEEEEKVVPPSEETVPESEEAVPVPEEEEQVIPPAPEEELVSEEEEPIPAEEEEVPVPAEEEETPIPSEEEVVPSEEETPVPAEEEASVPAEEEEAPIPSEEEAVPSEEEEEPVTPPEEPTPPAAKVQPKCPKTVEIDKDNAADVLCELSHYLGEFAQGHIPAVSNSEKVCFCMEYNEVSAPPTLLQIASRLPGHLQIQEPKVAFPLLRKFIKQRS